MKAIFMTDKGKVRQHNEDNGGVFLNLAHQRIAIVADGMGGHRAGDVASHLTIQKLKEKWEETERIKTAEEAENWFQEQIKLVNLTVYQHAQNNQECEGMGTTIVAGIITESFSTIAHIGDSRCYIFNESGFSQITEDHSLVNELVKTGQISKEDAEHHPRKNVLTRALGTEVVVDYDIKTIVFEENDILFLCSDGLSNKVNEEEMARTLKSEKSIEEKASTLIDLANEYGGEDNITLIIVEFNRDDTNGDEQ
ncbi:Stp1/IreP family PP2C-type Ser/Thr phosphatase [Niallia sp. Krafla_26]|uniref:Stp1/IreP family PP2C-type Ser/Thr phosphatase n=1 Tax=Niallia sp. Krafla_26 TaxID=3064703 RepID=UPI003D166B6E